MINVVIQTDGKADEIDLDAVDDALCAIGLDPWRISVHTVQRVDA